jgi:uncharacterized protein YndB with AHSA1/START domain
MAAPELRVETVIDAPPERVWAVLADFARWDQWNPTLLHPDGPPAAGTEVRMKLQLGPVKVPMRQLIREVAPPRRLVWRSRQPIPRALDVERQFEIEPVDDGRRSRLVQSETTTGWLAGAEVALLGKAIIRGYENLARALAERVAGEPA